MLSVWGPCPFYREGAPRRGWVRDGKPGKPSERVGHSLGMLRLLPSSRTSSLALKVIFSRIPSIKYRKLVK